MTVVDETKMQRARERLEAVRTEARATGPERGPQSIPEPEPEDETAATTEPEEV